MNRISAIELVSAFVSSLRSKGSTSGGIDDGIGDFELVVGGVGFRFSEKKGVLLASGYVAAGQVALVVPKIGDEVWSYVKLVAALQAATLGDGDLEIYTGTHDPRSEKPAVYLTKAFSSDFMPPPQFVLEVNWLQRWATYWRDQRWVEIFSSLPRAEILRQARSAQEWAVRNHPRPW